MGVDEREREVESELGRITGRCRVNEREGES